MITKGRISIPLGFTGLQRQASLSNLEVPLYIKTPLI